MANGSGISGFQLKKGSDEDEEEFGPSLPPSVPSGAILQRSQRQGHNLKTKVQLNDEIARAIFDTLSAGNLKHFFPEGYRETVAKGIAETTRDTLAEMADSPSLGQSISNNIRRAIDWNERAIPPKDIPSIVDIIQTAIKNTTKGKKINFPPNP